MLAFVPHSVTRHRAGFVRNPAAGWSINIPQWIPAPKKPAPVDMAAVDRVVTALSRFVAIWTRQSRDARAAARCRAAADAWTRAAMAPRWADLAEAEARRDRQRFMAMSDADWRAHCRAEIANTRDIAPLMAAWVPINAARDAAAARSVLEHTQVWNEMLHNRQQTAQVRVARVVVSRGRFAALDGSDSE